jgi:iron complex outermembrane receptor protein
VLNRCYTDATYTTLALACTAANLTPIAADFEDSERFKNFSPKLSLDYRMDENTLLYGLVSQRLQVGRLQHPRPGHAVPALAPAIR